MEPIRLGVVGLGGIATSNHLQIWPKMKDEVQIVALCDIAKEKLEKASKQFRVKKLYADIVEMLENENIDAIDICTPPNTHRDLCLKAFRAGINCIVEKPLATTVATTDELIKSARDNKVNLFVIHNYSFLPVLRKAKDLVHSGELGDVLQVDVKLSLPEEFSSLSNWAHNLPGGFLGEIAPHPCYILVEFLNNDIKDVKAQMIKRSSNKFIVGDELGVLVRTENAIGSFSVSLNSPTRRMIINLIGSKLWVFVDAEAQVLVKYPPVTGSRAVFHRGMRAMSDIFQRINCLAGVSFNVITGRQTPLFEGHKYLFSQAIKVLRGQGTYPVSLDMVRREAEILEIAFSQVGKTYELIDGRDKAFGGRVDYD